MKYTKKTTKNTKPSHKKTNKKYVNNKNLKGGQEPNTISNNMSNIENNFSNLGLNNDFSMNNPDNEMTPSNNNSQQLNTNTPVIETTDNNKKEVVAEKDLEKDLTYYEKQPDSVKFAIANREGYYLVGLDIGSFIQYVSNMFDKIVDKEEMSEKDSNTVKQFGEYVDQDYEQIIADIEGIRDVEITRPLLPEKYLGEKATLENITREAKKYSVSSKITPKGLYKLCSILSKYKKTEIQWLRIASLLEIIYQYSDVKQSRDDFFSSTYPLSISYLREAEEFWKAEHIFSSPKQLKKFKKNLEYYKHK